jgi:UDP-glucose-4-epimerase GalE
MRVLVTGGAGYIGSHAAKELSRQGFQPVVFDNLSEGHRWAVQWGPLVEAGLSSREAITAALRDHRIEAVIHFAASAYVGDSMRDPIGYFRNNVIHSLQLLEAMHHCGVGILVYSSTCATYGDPETLPLREDHPQRPVSPYGESKLFVEKALRWHTEAYGLRWAALRYFNASGADPEGEIGESHRIETHLIPLVIEAGLGSRPQVEIFGTDYPTSDGTAVRDYVHVSDLAEAHVRALRYLQEGGVSTAVNLGVGRGYSVREVITCVEQVGGVSVPVKLGPRRAGDPPVLVADPARARAVLGWQPRFDNLKAIVETAWRWHSTSPLAACAGTRRLAACR